MVKLTTKRKDIDMSAPISGQNLGTSQSYVQGYQNTSGQSTPSGNNDYKLPEQKPNKNVLPPVEDWDYKTAKTNMQGQSPLSYKLGDWTLKPKGYAPTGEFYFGEGLSGWFKGLAYKTLNIAWNDEKTAVSQKKIISDGFQKLQESKLVLPKTFGEFVTGKSTDGVEKESATGAAGNELSGVWDIVKGTWGLLGSNESVLEVPVKGVNLAATTVIDAFQLLADTTEQVLGMNKTMRRYVEEQGSAMPALGELNINPIKIGEEYAIQDELVNTLFRTLNPIMNVYDNVRFWSAPGTFKEKTEALKTGWYESRMLYSELVRPSVEAEFLRRMKEPGANPDLLAMELQDPYAELVGELILDPTNLIAAGGKTAKFASEINKAESLGGAVDDIVDVLKAGSNASTDAQVSGILDKAAEAIFNFGYKTADDGSIIRKVVGGLEYGISSLNARGMITKQVKSMSTLVTWIAGEAKHLGGTPDDVVDALSALVKLSSENPDEIKAGISFIKNAKTISSPIAFFGQQALETSHLMRNIIGKGDDIEKMVAKLKVSSWDEQAGIVTELLERSAKTSYPKISEMAEAAKKVGNLEEITANAEKIKSLEAELKLSVSQKAAQGVKRLEKEIAALKKTQTASTKDIALAQEYARLAKERPALVTLAKFDNEISKPWRQLNSAFSNIYFTNYGFAARQWISNNFMVFKEAGVGAWVQDGKFKSIGAIREELKAAFPAGLPAALDQKSIIESVEVSDNFLQSAFKKLKEWNLSPQALAANTEQGAGERVFYKFYRQYMDQVANFGVGIPRMEEFTAAGLSPEMAKDWQTIYKANGYNATKANEIFKAQYANGTELFRDLNWVSDDIKKGLKDYGGWDELVNFVKNPETKTPEQISSFIEDLIDDAGRKANGTVYDPNGVAKERALEHIEKFGSDAKEMRGFRELQTHLSNADNAAMEAFKSDLKSASATARKKVLEISRKVEGGGKLKPEEVTLMSQLNEWLSKSDLHINKADEMYSQNGEKLKELKRHLDAWMKENKQFKYGDAPREAKWQEWYKAVEDTQEEYFAFYNGGGSQLADDFGKLTGEDITKTFARSRDATVEVQKAKMVVAGKDGGIFHVPPKGYGYSVPGQNGHDLNVKKLAEYFGVPLQKNALLNTVNKYSDTKYTQLFDIKLEDVQRALQRKTGLDIDVISKWKGDAKLAENGINVNDIQKIKEKAKAIKEANAAGVSTVKSDSKEVQAYLDTVTDGMTQKQRDFGKASREARKTGNVAKLAYDKISEAVMNLPNESTSFTLESVAKKAEQFGVTVPPEFSKFFEDAGGSASRRDIIDFAARLEMGKTETTIGIKNAVNVPRSELPEAVSQRFADEARRLASELSGGEAGKRTAAFTSGTSNVPWYRDAYEKGLRKPTIDKALDKIIMDNGADKGVNVERMKEIIMDNFKLGDPNSGTPPDLYVLQQLGADEKTMSEALDNFNEITKSEFTFEEALSKSGAPSLPENAAQLTPDTSMPYYNDAGQLIQPGTVVENTKGLIPASPIHPGGTAGFSEARAWKEGQKELTKALKHIEQGLLERVGRRGADVADEAKMTALANFEKSITDKAGLAKLNATKVGISYRDFALHAYGETTNLDHAAQFILPYQFWYSRTYTNFAKSMVNNADIIAGYGKIKDFMANEYKDQPEWFKYNIKFPDFFGTNDGNPYMFNLESAIWPLQGLTGVDFQNPQKRTNWFTATVDDLGKFGPSVWTPISMAIASYYAVKGETDISAAWGTRLIPQTALVKSISSYFGTPIELDPNVHLFQGGLDPYEEGRVSRALAAMESEGTYTKEQLMEAARTHEGNIWDEAYQRATQARAPGQIMSSLFGVAFRPRTQDDIETDNFYADYARMRNLHESGYISDQDYAQGFNQLRERYPFMDIILLSRRAGMGREAAYAYNVISRIPPGMTKEIYEIIGIDPETAQKFYDSGGKLDGMSETEKVRFMAAMVDAGTILAIPKDSTRREWTASKNMYASMQAELRSEYGEDISDKISLYFGMDDREAAKLFIKTHPEVADALDAQTAYIANNQQLIKYYGGIDTLERYYTAQMYDKLEEKYGSEITNIEADYFDIFDKAEKKAYLREHPELKPYWDEKTALKQENVRQVVEFGQNLPNPEVTTTNVEPANPTQQELQDFSNPNPQISFEQWQQVIGQPMSELIQDYWYNGQDLPKEVTKNLGYMAEQYGYQDENEMLQAILISLP